MRVEVIIICGGRCFARNDFWDTSGLCLGCGEIPLKNGQKESYHCLIVTSTVLMDGYAQIRAGEKNRLGRHR